MHMSGTVLNLSSGGQRESIAACMAAGHSTHENAAAPQQVVTDRCKGTLHTAYAAYTVCIIRSTHKYAVVLRAVVLSHVARVGVREANGPEADAEERITGAGLPG